MFPGISIIKYFISSFIKLDIVLCKSIAHRVYPFCLFHGLMNCGYFQAIKEESDVCVAQNEK